MKTIFPLALLMALLVSCASRPGTHDVYLPGNSPSASPLDTATYPRSAADVSGPAVLALLNQAYTDLNAGRGEQAIAALERALRIEPRNPFIWQQLASTHLNQHRAEQAETVAQRSNSLARGNPYVELENWRLIAAARKARGDRSGVELAEEKMAELRDRIGD